MTSIDSILTKMTLEEKAALCTGAGPWTTTPIDRIGLSKLVVSDGPHGVRHPRDINAIASESYPATCFPTASAQASTWNPELIGQMGQALAEECIEYGVGLILGPAVNIKRSPLGGRNFEYFSEDPFLAGEMAASLISGVQSLGVGTSIKHFAVNNQEHQRFSINAEVDERTLREIYLPAFETAVKKTQPWSVMCAYNKVNGRFCSENSMLLKDILKTEWGFDGFVVSDWGAVHDRVAALKGGLDLEMPGPKDRRVQAVVNAVRSGDLDEAILDDSVRRILSVSYKAAQTPKGGSFDREAHHKLARKIAAEGMVLLKNDGVLPIKSSQNIAVIGRSASQPYFQGGGSSHINPTQIAVPIQAIQAQAGYSVISYSEGYPADNRFNKDMIDQAVATAEAADVALLFIALPESIESEGYDRKDLDLTPQQVALIKAVAEVQPRTVVILNNGAPVVVKAWIDDVAAVLEAWMMGQAGGAAVADILFGRINPSGKLAETFPVELVDTPAYLNWPGENGSVRYGEGLYVGYRGYDARRVPVQFPFGYGLSYTTFEYSNPSVSAETFKDVDGLTVSLDITNKGSMAGSEIVQIYIHDHEASLSRPEKELKGFVKVELQPDETKTVQVKLDFRSFAFYHPAYRQWITESGDFDLLIGASSQDIRFRLTVRLESTLSLPSILDQGSTIREWLADPRGKIVFEPFFKQVAAQFGQSLNGNEPGDAETSGMDMLEFLLDMPLLNILEFQENMLPESPEMIVAGLLAKVQEIPG